MLQVGIVVRAQILVVHAARETARAAAVGEQAPAPAGLDPARTSVVLHRSSGRVTAEVAYLVRTDIPVVGLVLPDLTLRGGAAMRVE